MNQAQVRKLFKQNLTLFFLQNYRAKHKYLPQVILDDLVHPKQHKKTCFRSLLFAVQSWNQKKFCFTYIL